jgi:hypothetical protein
MRRRRFLAATGMAIASGGCGAPTDSRTPPLDPQPPRRIAVRDVVTPSTPGPVDRGFETRIEVLDAVLDEGSTARIELALTNTADGGTTVRASNEGYTLQFYNSRGELPRLLLRDGRASRESRTRNCWRLTETFPPDAVFSHPLASGETVRSVRYVHGSPGNEPHCLPTGSYRFERVQPRWSFVIEVSEA